MFFKKYTHTAGNYIIDTTSAAALASHVMETQKWVSCRLVNSHLRCSVVRVVVFWYYSEDEKEINSAHLLFVLITSNPKCNLI